VGGLAEHRSLTILLRASASNEDAAAKMRNIFGGQIVPMLAKVTPPAELAVRAGLVSSQLLGLALCRYVLKVPPVVVVERERFGR